MAITSSAKKAVKRSEKLRQRNSEFKLRMKMAIKKFKKAIEKWDKVTLADLSNVQKYIDKCVKIGLIKKKNWSRKKSNMAKLFDTTKAKTTAK